MSLLQFKFRGFNSIHTLNIIPFSILIYEIFNQKNIKLFIFNFIIELIFFQLLHPYQDGIILNHLHNPEVDTVGMIFFISSFYLLLKYVEEKTNNIQSSNCLYFNMFFYKTFIYWCVFYSFINIDYLLQKCLNKVIVSKLSFFVILFFFCGYLKFLNKWMFIFPISITCFNVAWSPGLEEIETYKNTIKGFARDTRID